MQSPAPAALNPKPALPFYNADKCLSVKGYLCFRDKDREHICSNSCSNYSYCRSSCSNIRRIQPVLTSGQDSHPVARQIPPHTASIHLVFNLPKFSHNAPLLSTLFSLLELIKFKTLVRQNTPISSGGKTQTLADIFSCLLREKWSCIWMETCFSLNNCSYTLCIRNESDLMLNHSIYSTPISCMFTLKLTESFKLKSEFIITQYWFIILQKRQRSKLSTENWHCWVTDFDRPPAYCRSRTLSHYSFSFT